jgi:PAS domain S-box-containing protein
MSPEQFLKIADLFPDAALLLDREGRILAANCAAKSLGWPLNETSGQVLSDLTATPRDKLHDYLRLCSRSAQPVPGVLEFARDDGQTLVVRCFGSAIADADGGTATQTILRLSPKEGRLSQFAILSQSIDELTAEIQRRKEVEEELRVAAEGHRAMETFLTTLVEASGTLTGTLEPHAVLDSVVELSERMIPAEAYAIWRFEPQANRWHIASSKGISKEYQDSTISILEQTPAMPDKPVVANDVFVLPMLEDRRALYQSEGIRSLLALPLRIHGVVRGTLVLYHRQPHVFSEMEVRAATAIANLAGVAIGTADDYEQQRQLRLEAQQSWERFSRFMQHLPGLAWIKDPNGRYLYANASAEKVFAVPHQRLYGKTDEEIFPADVAAQFRENDAHAIALPLGVQTVEQLVHEDGLVHHSLVNKFAIPGVEGEPPLVGGMAIDISDRVRAEAELEQRERQLQLIANSVPVLIAHCDTCGRYQFVNKSYADRFGLSAADFLGKTIREVWGREAYDVIAPHIDAALAGQHVEFEAQIPHPTLGLQHVLCNYAPEFNAGGRVIGCVAAIVDVSPLKKVEEALREEIRVTETLYRIGRALAAELDLEKIMQTVTDEATGLTNAYLGAFFYNVQNPNGEAYSLYTISGTSRDAFVGLPMPRNTGIFEPTFRGSGAMRLDDVTKDPRYGNNAPYAGMPPGHLPVKSYLAAPVVSRTGEVLGGLFFGHPQPGKFTERHERLLVGIAAQAAVAVDNARLYAGIRESEERFRQLADHINAVFWLTDPQSGKFVYTSPAFVDMFGLPRDGDSVNQWALRMAVHSDDAPSFEAALTGQRSGEATSVEYRILRPDGSIRWIWDRGFPVRDVNGKLVRIAGVAEDVTQRKRVEQDIRFLADASGSLAALVDYESALQKLAALAVPTFADWCAVDMLDESGALHRLAVAHVDPSKVELAHQIHQRYPPNPRAPLGVWQIVRSGQSELVPEISDEILAATVEDDERLQIVRQLGLRSYMGVPLVVRGKVLGVVTFIDAESGRRYDERDLAVAENLAHRAAIAIENARLYQEVRDADRRKDEFLAMLAHELRNPLAPIANALQILRMPVADRDIINRSREVMERQVRHLVRLVDDLLDVSRVMRGKIELRRERVQLADVVAHAVEAIQPSLNAQAQELVISLPTQAIEVEVDQVRMSQIVSNLLTNAVKYTPPGGKIWVTITCQMHQAVLSVKDNGIGIAPEMLPKVFDLFVQVENSLSRSQGGLGIGLTLVRSLVQMHGGAIEAHSGGVGQGSEFVVRLPLATQQSVEQHLEQYAMPTQNDTQKRRILVVDDNVDAGQTLAMLLRLSGSDVEITHDGPSALHTAEDFRPQVIFLDIGMPGMDGYEVARKLRACPLTSDVLLVALTGWGQEEDRRRTAEAGFDVHLVKPVAPDALESVLSHPKASRSHYGDA